MNEDIRVLVVDDEAPIRSVLAESLRDDGYTVEVAEDGESALTVMQNFRPHVAFVDIWMPGRLDGLGLIQEAREAFPAIDYIVMSGHGTIETAVKATKLGAWDFIEKPISMDRVSILLSNVLNYQIERAEKNALLTRFRRNIALVGESENLVELKSWIASVAVRSEMTLISGEPGAGKGLVAENIHYLGRSASSPYISIKCESIPAELMEAELFGYERGAFAGSPVSKRGKLDLVENGTLHIDEITALDKSVQQKLFDAASGKSFARMGGGHRVPFIGRLILGSRNTSDELLDHGLIVKDFEATLRDFSFRIASLGQRADDIPSLTLHFSEQFVRAGGYRNKTFTPKAIEHMKSYGWPGNVRELRNFVERIFILIPGVTVDIEDLELAGLRLEKDEEDASAPFSAPNFKVARAQFEREFILRKLEENQGNISKTAELIGVERSHLHRKIKAYGIEVGSI